MAHDNAESYHPVPSIRRVRSKFPISGKDSGEKTNLTDEHGPVVKTEVEKQPGGSAMVRAHHAKGHVEEHQHPNEAAAHDHAKDLMSGGDSMRSDGQVDTDTDAECPHCGAQMTDGECPQCGYKAPPTDRAAGQSDADADDGY